MHCRGTHFQMNYDSAANEPVRPAAKRPSICIAQHSLLRCAAASHACTHGAPPWLAAARAACENAALDATPSVSCFAPQRSLHHPGVRAPDDGAG
jgi:hypothetical protein